MVLRRDWALGIRAARLSLGMVALSAPVMAQGVAPVRPAPAPAAAPAPVAPAVAPVPAAAPAPVQVQPAVAAPSVEAAPVAPVAPEEPLPAVTAAPAALPDLPPAPAAQPDTLPPQPDEDWYESFDVRVFADAYFSWNYNSPKPQVGGNDVIRAYDTANGFALANAGLDISHAAEPIGGTVSLRFGPGARRYASSCFSAKCDSDYGLENVKQAFASWRPGGDASPVTIDFGKFDTIYGAEVAESQDNMNYTRGVLYWLGQPRFHTGLRVNAELSQNFSLRGLVVNGWNNTIDNNSGKSFGLQATAHAPRTDSHDWVSASLGYLGGPERDDILPVSCPTGSVFDASNASGCRVSATAGATSGTIDRPSTNTSGWRHFIDLVVTSDPTDKLHLAFNADFGSEKLRDSSPMLATTFSSHSWVGAMLGARYLVTESFAVAGRAEVYHDADGVTTGSVNGLPIKDVTITTGTLTLDYLPSHNLLFRLDNRLDHSTKEMFPKGVRDLTGNLFTTTLGVVVTTN